MIDGPKEMHMRTNFGAGALACVVAGFIGLSGAAAQNKPVPRVGFVAGAGGYFKMAVTNQAFFDGLADAGYKDGSTMTVVFRTAEGNMSLMPALINDVLAEKVDFRRFVKRLRCVHV
jgi:putative tryptophan/tyrosine transport system substrate-binding protein